MLPVLINFQSGNSFTEEKRLAPTTPNPPSCNQTWNSTIHHLCPRHVVAAAAAASSKRVDVAR